jgi:hypothetical protein
MFYMRVIIAGAMINVIRQMRLRYFLGDFMRIMVRVNKRNN